MKVSNANTETISATDSQMSNNDCLVLQEIDAASAVSAVTGPETMNNHCAKTDIDTKASLIDKSRLITEMEDKFARETNSALKKRPVYKKHGITDTNHLNGQKKGDFGNLEKSNPSSTSSLASDSMMLLMKEPGELDVHLSKKKALSLVGTDLYNQNSIVDALNPPNITNGSQEDSHEESEASLKLLEAETAEQVSSMSCNSSGLAKSLRKVRVKRCKEKIEDAGNTTDDMVSSSNTVENDNSLTLDMAAKPLTSSQDSNPMAPSNVKRSPLSPAVNLQTSPRKPNQGPRRYYEQTLENNFILSPTILSKADAEQSTVALFKIPSRLTYHSQLHSDAPDESSETQMEKYLANNHAEPTQTPSSSSLKTVIRVPKSGSKKKGKRRFVEEEAETPEDSSVQTTHEKRKKNKYSHNQSGQQNNSSSLVVDDFEYVNDSPSPEPLKMSRPDDSSVLPDDKHGGLESQKTPNDEKLQG